MARRRRLLMLAYFFPPLGGAGVQRSVKQARYLPDHGWDPTVVTVRSRDYWMIDETLLDELGPTVRVVRTGSLTGLTLLRRVAPRQSGDPGRPRGSARAMGRLRALSGWVLMPDAYVGWVPFAVRAALQEHAARPFDAIYTTSSPDSAHLAGRRLARRLRLPWIADFRDPWTRRLSYRPPTRLHDAWHRRLEGAVLREADRITVTAPETRDDYLQRYPDLPGAKVQVITNGYDESDFAHAAGTHPCGDRMRILHAGQLNPERPAAPFLIALRRLLAGRPGLREKLSVRFLGPYYQSDVAAARELGVQDLVAFVPGRPHREVISELMRSHLLLLMERDNARGGLILPGKIFEYLRARRPILGLVPPGAAWRMIESLGVGRCCRTGDSAAAARLLADYANRFLAGTLGETGISDEQLLRFDRRTLARALAAQLEELVGPVGKAP